MSTSRGEMLWLMIVLWLAVIGLGYAAFTTHNEAAAEASEEGEDEKTSTSVAAKTLCIPFDQPELPAGTKCLVSDMDATCWILWGRSY